MRTPNRVAVARCRFFWDNVKLVVVLRRGRTPPVPHRYRRMALGGWTVWVRVRVFTDAASAAGPAVVGVVRPPASAPAPVPAGRPPRAVAPAEGLRPPEAL